MYGIFTSIYHKNQRNVGKYALPGSYGSWESEGINANPPQKNKDQIKGVINHYCLIIPFNKALFRGWGGGPLEYRAPTTYYVCWRLFHPYK